MPINSEAIRQLEEQFYQTPTSTEIETWSLSQDNNYYFREEPATKEVLDLLHDHIPYTQTIEASTKMDHRAELLVYEKDGQLIQQHRLGVALTRNKVVASLISQQFYLRLKTKGIIEQIMSLYLEAAPECSAMEFSLDTKTKKPWQNGLLAEQIRPILILLDMVRNRIELYWPLVEHQPSKRDRFEVFLDHKHFSVCIAEEDGQLGSFLFGFNNNEKE